MRTPADCRTKQDIREEIDRLDRQLIALLSERFDYVRRMAELKQDPAEAHSQPRIDDVLDKVAARAEAAGLDADLIRDMWRSLIDWNVDYGSWWSLKFANSEALSGRECHDSCRYPARPDMNKLSFETWNRNSTFTVDKVPFHRLYLCCNLRGAPFWRSPP